MLTGRRWTVSHRWSYKQKRLYRKLKPRWSIETAEELRLHHRIDIIDELTTAMAEEINREIDKEVLGQNYLDAGYFYCPYIPLVKTPVVLDPESFKPKKGILTRYGKKLLKDGAKFYARKSITNFPAN